MATTDQNCEQWIFNHVQKKPAEAGFLGFLNGLLAARQLNFFLRALTVKHNRMTDCL